MRELKELLAGRSDEMDLDRAALTLATIEFPGLAFDPYLRLLDSYAANVADRARDLSDGRAFVSAANRYLFGELGLTGNAEDYYNPHNSCLNQVLDTRLGIPITLALIYMGVGRRLAKPVHGIGLPRHFVLQYDDGEYSTFIDPFHSGALLTAEDCFELAQMSTPDAGALAPIGKRQILHRMMNNLRGIYVSTRAYPKALAVLDLLIEANPDSAEQYKQRALVYLQTRQLRAARADLMQYLRLAPEAEEEVSAIIRWMASMN